MNLDEVQNLWNSGINGPTAHQRAEMITRFTSTLRRRRRQEFAWLVWTFFVLTVLTGFAGWLVFGTDKVSLSAEWAVIPLLLIPWVFACLFLRKFLRQTLPAARGDVTISDSLTAAMAANESERFKLKALGMMYVIALPVLALSIGQLHSAGKVPSRELISMVTFLGGALALSAGAVAAKYWFSLVPKARMLKALLSQFREPAEGTTSPAH
ncbi:MAG: hypothetical protein H7Y43_10375 [Akkermansiaceae bacterium]|nr:hypothetical protein [Verrucomicrobiales bacterium]